MSELIPAGRRQRPRGVYLLPNLFTVTALFAGFFAMVAGMKGHYDNAAIAIFIAMIMDSLDGRVARLTHTQTAFGAQFDSLSDMVSFGIAPALVLYSWTLNNIGNVGWLAAFIFAVGGALRLARFNVQIGKVDKRYFIGLPIPAAAANIAGWVWVGQDFTWHGITIPIISAFMSVILGLLMVSNIRYRSFKDFDVKGKVPFIVLMIIVFILVLISLDPPEVLFTIAIIFALSGPLTLLWRKVRKRPVHHSPKSHS